MVNLSVRRLKVSGRWGGVSLYSNSSMYLPSNTCLISSLNPFSSNHFDTSITEKPSIFVACDSTF